MELQANEIAVFSAAIVNGKPQSHILPGIGQPPQLLHAKRGKIHGLSKAATRRLREILATTYVPCAKSYGVTLTVPWRKPFDGLYDIYRASFNRFGVSLLRTYPHSACVFRHELQTRKMPHCHCLFWCHDEFEEVLSNVSALWIKACPLLDGSLCGFARRGVQVKPIDTMPGVFRYLADHTSKHKQAQLGYKGKQWGILGRRNLRNRDCEIYSLDPIRKVLIDRQISRVYRYCKDASCVFGYKHLRRRKTTKISFCRAETIRRIIDFYSK